MTGLGGVCALAILALLAGCLSSPTAPPESNPPVAWMPVCTLSNWSDPCTVHASPNESPSKIEVDVAVNPLDPLNVFVASKDLDPVASDCVWSVGQVTKDGGETWKTVYVGGTAAERQDPTHPLFGWSCVSDPNVLFGQDGTLYYLLQFCCALARPSVAIPTGPIPGVASRPLSALMLAVSHDGGESFALDDIEVLARGSGHGYYHDFPRMEMSPVTETLVVAIHAKAELLPSITLETFRRERGGPPEGPAFVLDRPAETAVNTVVSIAADAAGTFYLAIHSFTEDLEQAEDPFEGAFLYRSTDDGRSFTLLSDAPFAVPAKVVPTNSDIVLPTILDLAASPLVAGQLHAVWQSEGTGGSDIFYTRSLDGGLTWSKPAPINRDGTDNAQWLPRIRVAEDGSVHVAFIDKALDPEDRLYGVTHLVSVDDGTTWTSTPLVQVLSDPDLGQHQDDRASIGDYIGLSVVNGDAWVGFPQEHEGRMEIGVAHLVRLSG